MASLDEIEKLPAAVIQARLPKVPDAVIAAALVDAPPGLAEMLRRNLSPRRGEGVAEHAAGAARLPARTRQVARRVLTKVLLGIDDEETRAGAALLAEKPPDPEELRRAMERSPVAREARAARGRAAVVERLRRLLHGG